MKVQNKAWYVISRILEVVVASMGILLLADAWILGDAGPDAIWWLNACIAGLTMALGAFAEKKAGITYENADDSSDDEGEDEYEEETAPVFLRRMR